MPIAIIVVVVAATTFVKFTQAKGLQSLSIRETTPFASLCLAKPIDGSSQDFACFKLHI